MAFQHGTVEEQEVVKATWKELAAKFFTAASENNKPKQYHRTKVFEWLCATEHELKVATGSGWGQFKVPSENKPPAAERKSVTVTVDQGADGWSALQYLAASGHNIVPINGPSHRVWNDAQLAMQDAGLQSKLLASIIILNADGGPWHTSRWWHSVREGSQEFLKVSDSGDSLFQRYLQRIRDDQQFQHDWSGEEGSERELFEGLSRCVDNKVSEVSMTRWFNYVTTMRAFLERWHSKLVVSLYIVLSLGLLQSGTCHDMTQLKFKPKANDEDVEKATTKEDQEEVRRVRQMCKNTLVFTTVALSTYDLYRTNIIIVDVLSPLERWHSWQNKLNRSASESRAYWVEIAADKGLRQVNDILAKVKDTGLFAKAKVCLEGCDAGFLKMDVTDPNVIDQNETAQMIGDLALALAARRLRTCAWYVGYPGSFPAMLDDAHVAGVLAGLRQALDDMDKTKDLTGAHWTRMRKRSPLHWAKVEQVVEIARSSDWQVTPALTKVVSDDISGVTQTKLIEDGVHCERVAERKAANHILSGAACWDALFEDGLEHQKHRFIGLQYQDEVVPRGLKDRNVSGLFEIRPKLVPRAYNSIVTTSAQAPYPTSNPAMMSASVEDQALIRYCIEREVLPLIDDAWMCTLVPSGKLLLRNPGFLDGRWFVGWQTASGSCLVGLPLEVKKVNGSEFFVLINVDKFYFLPIVQPTQWECCPFQWISPLHVFLATGMWCQELLAKPLREAQNLLEMSARFGFWSLPKAALTKIAVRAGYEVDKEAKLPAMLLQLSSAILGELSEEEQLATIRHRLP